MLFYLDTCIVIYAVEGQPAFQQRAQRHIATLEAAGHRFLISELTRAECLVKPLGAVGGDLLLEYATFFLGPSLTTVPLTAAVHDRAALTRGRYRYGTSKIYGLADPLHLAVAIESRCEHFLTNDLRLSSFPDLAVDVLP
ncbi:MAG: type II toxin-antitoxin system VapC family toxin [Gemmataceae bacterium]